MQNLHKPLIKGRDIIIVGQQPWDTEIGSNCKDIAMEMAKLNRVLYVNSPLDRITLYRKSDDPKIIKRINVVKGKEDGLLVVQDRLWNLFPDTMIESINWIKPQSVFEWLNKLNNQRFAASIRKAIEQLGFKDFILFNDNDMFRSYHLKELLNPIVSVYYSRDYMLAVDYWKLHGEKMEPELIAKSDVCTANSTYLADHCRKHNPKSFYVGQGCELDIFSNADKTERPKDMPPPNARPIIGYVGALQHIRLDIDVIAHIAYEKKEWDIVLIGPEDDTFKASKLHTMENVIFLGGKPPLSLPAYIHSFDVCINPQIVNQVTIGNYPRKIDEYLAVGKPVVATYTEAMGIFSEHVLLAKTKEEYVAMIEKALAEDVGQASVARKAFAASHTWENSVADIYGAIVSSCPGAFPVS